MGKGRVGKEKENLCGRWGKLLVISKVIDENNGAGRRSRWNCICDCGTNLIVKSTQITGLKIPSCGCLKEILKPNRADVVISPELLPEYAPRGRFGKLTVVEPHVSRYPVSRLARRWKCLCDCGNYVFQRSGELKSGSVRSCGCLQKEIMIETNSRGITPQEASMTDYYNRYKCDAHKKNNDFELSRELFAKLVLEPCAYCGAPPYKKYNRSLSRKTIELGFYPSGKAISDRVEEKTITVNGVDRIDNFLGYTEINSCSCCTICNGAKSNRNLEDFLKWMSVVSEFEENRLIKYSNILNNIETKNENKAA